jgi:hypothetical protein
MTGDLYSILWEDLAEAEGRILKVLSVLRELQHAVEQGQIDQPDRQDSNRLNRLMVLADLLYAETRPWTDEITGGQNPSQSPAGA